LFSLIDSSCSAAVRMFQSWTTVMMFGAPVTLLSVFHHYTFWLNFFEPSLGSSFINMKWPVCNMKSTIYQIVNCGIMFMCIKCNALKYNYISSYSCMFIEMSIISQFSIIL
jgi:hypothetical protein